MQTSGSAGAPRATERKRAGVQTSGSARAPRATERERAGVQTSGSAGAPRATERERAGKGPAPRVQREMQSPGNEKLHSLPFLSY